MISASDETTAQLQCTAQGGPFQIVQVPRPSIEPGSVLIRLHAIGYNGLDQKQRQYGILVEKWPHVLGIEGAGVIEAVGSDVSDRKPGDEVMAWAAGRAHGQPWGGAFQERIVVPARFTAIKPKNVSFEEAASIPVCYNTAVIAIYDGLDVPLPFIPHTATTGRGPESVLVLGGSSSVGANAIQLLRLAYPEVPILATSSPAHHKPLRDLGASTTFDYRSESLITDIKNASPGGSGVDMIIDCVGSGAQQKTICDVLNPKQSMRYSSVFTGVDVAVPKEVKKYTVSGWSIFDVQGGGSIIPAITTLLESGVYKVPLPVRVVGNGLEQIPETLPEVLKVSGEKLVITLRSA